jgi:twitching motility protein PilT
MELNQLELVDLYLGYHEGASFCDVKRLPGADASRQPLAAMYEDEVAGIRTRCETLYADTKRPEFPLLHKGIRYRVTAFDNPNLGSPFFTLSRVSAKLYPLEKLGLPEHIEKLLISPSLRGLVLLCGAMSSGKTSSAASVLAHRLSTLGGLAMAVEDPIETLLDGMHGDGRCIQVEVSRTDGGYGEALTRVLRARVGTVLVGEIRDEATAEKVLSLASTDHLVISTIHASSPTTALELLYTYATKAGVKNAAGLVARGISLVIYLQMRKLSSGRTMLDPECVSFFEGNDAHVLRKMLADGDFGGLPEMFAKQHKQSLHI